MEGLAAIEARIAAQAAEKAAQITAHSAAHLAQLRQQTDQACAEIMMAAQQKSAVQIEAIRQRAVSQAALERRRQLLAARQQLIDTVLGKAVEHLQNWPPERKADLFDRILHSLDQTAGEVTVNAADWDLARTWLARQARPLTLAPAPGSFSGGLILRQGRIEDNRTFDLAVRSQQPQLAALAAAVLFPEE